MDAAAAAAGSTLWELLFTGNNTLGDAPGRT